MEPQLAQVVRNAGWLLVVGGVLGTIGACWPPYRQWSAPLEEGLRVIAGHPIGWKLIHTGFITGIWTMAVGMTLLAYAMRGTGGSTLALAAALLLGMAALLWTLNIATRLSVTVWAANELVASGAIPDGYASWRRLASYLFAGFSVLGYASVAISGWLVLKSTLAAAWVGWLLVAWGLTGGFVVGANVPLLVYVALIVLGSQLLRG